MVFVFYQFNPSPINFNPEANEVALESNYAEEYKQLQSEQIAIFEEKKALVSEYTPNADAAYLKELETLNKRDRENREAAKAIVVKSADDKLLSVESNDKDYVFIYFILNNLPRGLIGLLLAVILSAAMSSTASELNALASTTSLDIYKRNFAEGKSESHYVKMTRIFTFGWGILAVLVACVAYLAENLIELVNIIGSNFYGNVLGIFLLAFFFKYLKGTAVFVAALITQALIFSLYYLSYTETIELPYLWLNVIGCLTVMLIAHLINPLFTNTKTSTS